MSDLVSLKFKNKLKSSMKEHLISFLERKRLAGYAALQKQKAAALNSASNSNPN